MDYIIRLVIYSVAVLIVSRLTHLIEIKNFGTALLFAFVLGIVNVLIRPIFLFISLPLIALTFGIFLIFINGLMIIIAGAFFRNVQTKGCLSSAIASVLISLVVFLFEMVLFPGQTVITY
ncbi:MAG: phage holin family protein [Candidatus Cloacimonetes bacterium]|nr:phage holin family protein [Candidatus Cloacimonadota bacterium]